MGNKFKKAIPYILGSGIGTFIFSFPARFLENWLMSILQEQIQGNWREVLSFTVVWLLPLIVSIALIYFGYRMRLSGKKNNKEFLKATWNADPAIKLKDMALEAAEAAEAAERRGERDEADSLKLTSMMLTQKGVSIIKQRQQPSVTNKNFSINWESEEWWLRDSTGQANYWDDETGAIGLLLKGMIAVNPSEPIQVESLSLDLCGQLYISDWKSYKFHIPEECELQFNIPLNIPRGKRTAELKAIVDGQQYTSKSFMLNLPEGKQVFHRGDS